MEVIEKSFSGKRVSVFEWGSGASTIWMARRGFDVISVEHDQRWAEAVKLKSQELDLPFESIVKEPTATNSPRAGSRKRGFEGLDFRDYVDEINHYGLFDLIVIDGRARTECLLAAKSHLKKDGKILFDNSNRKRYRDQIEKDMIETVIKGVTPASPLSTQSSILAFR
jgi:predicted O-methyltransferase YrrM